jgi:hypothetical protein
MSRKVVPETALRIKTILTRRIRNGVEVAASIPPKQPKFEGKSDDLKGHIYDCSSVKQADAFVKTMKEIAEYVGRTYKYGSDVRLAVLHLSSPTIAMPPDPADLPKEKRAGNNNCEFQCG